MAYLSITEVQLGLKQNPILIILPRKFLKQALGNIYTTHKLVRHQILILLIDLLPPIYTEL
jgi:hypothetical protein